MDQVSNYLIHSNIRGSRISIFVCNALNDARGYEMEREGELSLIMF